MDLIHIHETDNVALCRAQMPAGSLVNFCGNMLQLTTDVPAMHKVAIRPISRGDAVFKYGQAIGFASTDIAVGEHVHEHNMNAGPHKPDYAFCSQVPVTDYVAESARATFRGFRRASGQVGTRNFLAVVSTVNCSVTVSRAIAAHFNNSGKLRDFPNVDGVIALGHESGCGMSTNSEGYRILMRTLHGYITHPNFAGVLLIGLGCEAMQVNNLLSERGLQTGPLSRP